MSLFFMKYIQNRLQKKKGQNIPGWYDTHARHSTFRQHSLIKPYIMKQIALYSSLLAVGYFSVGRLYISGCNPNICYIIIMILLLGTIYTVTQFQKMEFGRFKTLAINIVLVSVLFLSFYIGINSTSAPNDCSSLYSEKQK